MSLLSLPPEILVLIASQLESRDFIPLLQLNHTFYNLLIYELCKSDVSNTGGLALSFYAFWNYEARVRDMLAAGANVDIQNPHWRYRTPLMLAVSRHHRGIAKILLEHGANPNFTKDVMYGPLDLAILSATSDDVSMMDLLLDNGADINLKGYRDRTPLHTAVRCQETAKLAFLLARGADVSVRESTKGRTPLHVAVAEYGPTENVRILLEAGSEVEARDSEGLTPFQIAASSSDGSNFAALLVEYGARTQP